MDTSHEEFLTKHGSFLKAATSRRPYESSSDDDLSRGDEANVTDDSGESEGTLLRRMQGRS